MHWRERTCLARPIRGYGCEQARGGEGHSRGSESESSERFQVHGDDEKREGWVRERFIPHHHRYLGTALIIQI